MLNRYLRFSKLGFVVWPGHIPSNQNANIQHSQMADAIKATKSEEEIGKLISAGFCHILGEQTVCFGFSMTTNLKSLKGDSELLTRQLNLQQQ